MLGPEIIHPFGKDVLSFVQIFETGSHSAAHSGRSSVQPKQLYTTTMGSTGVFGLPPMCQAQFWDLSEQKGAVFSPSLLVCCGGT